ncbi:hypothetical protein AAG570_002952 [Ranatra chinensis]|uniref:Ferritin n=1 Tax=Ranatra chinensis TaxID=642074 RepID=A0ABD0Y5G3_9HEMI
MFLHNSREETEHAEKLMAYQNKRGGKLAYKEVRPPLICQLTAKVALQEAIKTEKKVTQSLEEIVKLGEKCHDYHLCDFITAELLSEQYSEIKKLCDLYTTINMVGGGLGLHTLDRKLLKEYQIK